MRRAGLLAFAGLTLGHAAQAQVGVTSLQPARHAVAAPRNSAVTVGFSQAISAASASNLRVYSARLRGKVPGSVTGGGTATLALTPAQNFAAGDVVSVSLPATMSSTGGTALARHVYQFTTATGGTGRGYFMDTTIVANTTNRDQLLGDLDNDGDLDLVTTGALYGCRIFLNNGSGRYTFKTGLVAGQTPSGTALADVDQDGDLDLLVGDADNNSVAVCINDGLANFIGSVTGAQNSPVGVRPVSIAVGDVDGDGDLDFATANGGASSVSVRLNNGALPLLYTGLVTVAVGVNPTSVALGDVDNDGDLDLLTTNAGTAASPLSTVSVSRNSGTGSFGAATTFTVGAQPSELVLADVDGDGDQDLLTANAGDATVSVRLNNGTATFSGSTTLALPAGSTPTGLRAGDVDADGDLDLVVAQGVGGRVFTFLNAAGTFTVQARALRLSRSPSPTATSVGVTLGDVDADGDLDVVTSDTNGQVMLSLNSGPPPPLPSPTIAALTPNIGPVGTSVVITGTNLTDVTAVRFNGTTAPGYVLNGTGTSISVAVPAGAATGVVTVATEDAGTATSAAPFTVTLPVPVLLTATSPARHAVSAPRGANVSATFSVAITTATAGNLRVFGNQRRGNRPGVLTGGGTPTLTFDPTQDFMPGEAVSVSLPASLRAADGNPAARQVLRFTAAAGGTGQMNFGTATALAATNPGEPVLGDLDNDGDLDLLLPNRNSGTVTQRLNNGAGTFTAGPDIATGLSGVASLTLADLDADGDLDVVALPRGAEDVPLLFNNGSGTFSRSTGPSLGQALAQMVAGDVDADGDLDLIFMPAANQSTYVYLNNGVGSFAFGSALYFSTGSRSLTPTGLALGDLDADGDLDLVVGGYVPYYGIYTVNTHLNDGAGQFTAAQQVNVVDVPSRLSLNDLDNDGDLDLTYQTTLNYITKTSTQLNNGTGTLASGGDVLLGGVGQPVLADADADGDLDLLSYDGIGVNNGAGGFAAIVPIPTTSVSPAGIAVGDVDGDGDLDLVTSQENNVVSVRLNLPLPAPTVVAFSPGSGAVGTSVIITGTNLIGTRAVAFNGVAATGFAVNSRTELVATVPAGATTGPVSVTTPAGTAASATSFTVTQPVAVLSVSPVRNAASAPRATAVAVTFAQPISTSSAGNLRVFGARVRGQRAGTLTGGGTSTLTFAPTQPFAPGELVSVSLPSTLVGPTSTQVVRPHVFQFTAAAGGTGTGVFNTTGTANIPINSRASGLTMGDLNNDGAIDVVASDGSIRLNDGSGAFSGGLAGSLYLRNYPYAVALADLDGNGTLDLVSAPGEVLLNDGTATFTAANNFANLGPDTRDVATGDFDGDGDLDVVVPKYTADSLLIRFNNGSAGFPTVQRVGVGARPKGLAVGDVDNDGDLDLLVACEGNGSGTSVVSICFNNGGGLFTRVVALPANGATANVTSTRLALGDLDGDGALDLVTNAGIVRLNNGTGTFSGTQATATGANLTLGDVDADGDLDLLTSNGISGAVLCVNNGQGVLTATPSAISEPNSWGGVALADIDGDGDLDALTNAFGAYVVYVRLNHRVAPPVISGFAPGIGLPGATVVLTGADFIGTTAVAFNGTAAPGFVVNTAGQLTVSVPAGATSGVITATTPAGTGTSATAFTVLRPVAVTSVSPARNAVVGLSTPVSATFSQAIPTNTAANLTVFSAQRGGRRAGTRAGAGTSTLTFTPTQAFEPGELVSVSIPAYTDANQTRVVKQAYQFRAAVGGTGRGFLAAPINTTLSTAVSTPANDLTMGDVDGDGAQDMLVHDGSAVQVQRNTGAGTFTAAGSVAVAGTSGSQLVLGDVDGDGDLDLAAMSSRSSVVSIRLNNGSGVFGGTQDVSVGDAPRAVALADMDADGDLDLVTGNQGSSSCTTSVRFNDGSGNFSGTTNELFSNGTNTSFSNLQIGDVDADGDLDLLVGNGGGVFICLNNGQGGLAATTAGVPLSNGSGNIFLGDLDADGDLDLLASTPSNVQGTPSRVKVALNDGRGNFAGNEFALPSIGGLMRVGDVDADGDFDIIMTYVTDPSELWVNNGRATFTRQMELSLGYVPAQMALSDVDGDGDLDVVSSNYYTPTVYSVRLNGPPSAPVISSFAPPAGPEGTAVVITGTGFFGATAVRFNGTNAPGFVVNSTTRISVNVPVGATTGTLSVTTPVGTATSVATFTVIPLAGPTAYVPARNALAVARNATVGLTFPAAMGTGTAGNLRVFGNQLRGRRPGVLTGGGTASLSFDPDQDFAPGEQISVSLPATMQTTTGGIVRKQVYQFTAATGGPGGGAYRAGTDVLLGQFATAVAVGDLDNDGDLDIITAPYSSGASLTVQLNNGQARFSQGVVLPPYGATVSEIVLADVDGDGDLDILACYSFNLVVCLNNGNATFAPAVFTTVSGQRFAMGDMDADGDLDFVSTTYQSNALSVALNDGTGRFTTLPYQTTTTPLNLALGDVDGDGDLDVVTANDTNGAQLFLNNGAGVLASGLPYAFTGETRSVALADVDANGDLDLAVGYNDTSGSNSSGWLAVLANNGSGVFTASGQRMASGGRFSHLKLGDVDHDGDLDLLTANGLTDNVSIRLNNGQGGFSGNFSVAVPTNPSQLVLGDLDGDGDLDFTTTQSVSGTNYAAIRLNDGQLLASRPGAGAAGRATLYPNPAHGQFRVLVPVKLRAGAGTAPARLYNALGQAVLEQPFRLSAAGELTVSVAHLPAGIYTLHLPLTGEAGIYKIVLE
ncbi:FG-GAP-like repeat-containing protein [Hymenobacter monticola]|uniref:FG-GAP-like repeat-containing protein n=1 Tax=Hymenobacter monticola TaxID=1705399 RepID=A0ABY4B8L2_9BACT|nr:FG-GAP-like repeat-containing protein [Hymenobacter monticola]UOE35513.1 FG-GAP-like repeat-containing protein [Hymenobacter monticola]